MKGSAEVGLMPAKVSVKRRPMVTAGLANEVEEVNQYAAPMYAPTAGATAVARPVRTRAKMTSTTPAVATTSPTRWTGGVSSPSAS